MVSAPIVMGPWRWRPLSRRFLSSGNPIAVHELFRELRVKGECIDTRWTRKDNNIGICYWKSSLTKIFQWLCRFFSGRKVLRWWFESFKNLDVFTLEVGKSDPIWPIWRAHFLDGLKPPTSDTFDVQVYLCCLLYSFVSLNTTAEQQLIHGYKGVVANPRRVIKELLFSCSIYRCILVFPITVFIAVVLL